MRISDWSSDVCSSDLIEEGAAAEAPKEEAKADKPANDKKTDVPATTPQKPAAGAEEVQPKTAAGKSGTPSKTEDLPPGARFTAAHAGLDPSPDHVTGRPGAGPTADRVNYPRGPTAGVPRGARPSEPRPLTRTHNPTAPRRPPTHNT